MVIGAIEKDKAGGGGGEHARVGVRVLGKPRWEGGIGAKAYLRLL